MRKPKKQPNAPKPESNLLEQYDSFTLTRALNSLETSVGWSVFVEYLNFVAASHNGYALDLAQRSGTQFEACSAASKAEVLREVTQSFMDQLKSKVLGKEVVVEEPLPY